MNLKQYFTILSYKLTDNKEIIRYLIDSVSGEGNVINLFSRQDMENMDIDQMDAMVGLIMSSFELDIEEHGDKAILFMANMIRDHTGQEIKMKIPQGWS